jgi:mannose-6-phosphate isomerase-like protein (cupin superfamily)
MRLARAGTHDKGWITGPWDSDLPVGIGFATVAVDEPHRHERNTEIYLIASGAAIAVVDGVAVEITAGDVLIIEPHEIRTFTSSSSDFRSFVLHVGGDGSPDKVPAG